MKKSNERNGNRISTRSTVADFAGAPSVDKYRTLRSEENIRMQVLELSTSYGNKAMKEEALADLLKIYTPYLLRLAYRLACTWGLMEPIEATRKAVGATLERASETLADFSLPKRKVHGPFFGWISGILFDRLRKARDEQAVADTGETDSWKNAQKQCRRPVAPSHREIERRPARQWHFCRHVTNQAKQWAAPQFSRDGSSPEGNQPRATRV